MKKDKYTAVLEQDLTATKEELKQADCRLGNLEKDHVEAKKATEETRKENEKLKTRFEVASKRTLVEHVDGSAVTIADVLTIRTTSEMNASWRGAIVMTYWKETK